MSLASQPKQEEGQGRVLADVQELLQTLRRKRGYGKITLTVQAGDVVAVEQSETVKYK